MMVILWFRYIMRSVPLETMVMGNISWTVHGLKIFQAKWHFSTIEPAALQLYYECNHRIFASLFFVLKDPCK